MKSPVTIRRMSKPTILDEVHDLGDCRTARAQVLNASPLAPRRPLTPAALGMWFSRGCIPEIWSAAVLERLGRIVQTGEAA